MAKAGTAVVSEAHAVGPFVIDINSAGQGHGQRQRIRLHPEGHRQARHGADNHRTGCHPLQVQLPRFNRQMSRPSGALLEKKYVDFGLMAYEMNKRPGGYYEIKGTLRR